MCQIPPRRLGGLGTWLWDTRPAASLHVAGRQPEVSQYQRVAGQLGLARLRGVGNWASVGLGKPHYDPPTFFTVAWLECQRFDNARHHDMTDARTAGRVRNERARELLLRRQLAVQAGYPTAAGAENDHFAVDCRRGCSLSRVLPETSLSRVLPETRSLKAGRPAPSLVQCGPPVRPSS